MITIDYITETEERIFTHKFKNEVDAYNDGFHLAFEGKRVNPYIFKFRPYLHTAFNIGYTAAMDEIIEKAS